MELMENMHKNTFKTKFRVILFFYLLLSIASSQNWLVRPSDVSVSMGVRARLRCSVDVQNPIIWWKKVDTGAYYGLDTKIDNGPVNVTYDSDLDNGRRDLVFSYATLDNDGDYQCSAGIESDRSTMIQATATLNVHVAPTNIKLTAPQELLKPSDETVVKIRPDQVNMLKLTCVAGIGKPSSTIKWYRDDDEIMEGIETNSEYAEGKLLETTSVLSVEEVTKQDDGAVYRCEAYNEANVYYPLKAAITTSVMYSPSTPIIEYIDKNLINDGYLSAGTTIKMKCTTIGGNPRPRLQWFKDGVIVDSEYEGSKDDEGRYVTVNLLKLTLNRSDNAATYVCTARNAAGISKSAEKTMSVRFKVDKVKITGKSTGKRDQTITLTCRSEVSYPAANLIWDLSDPDAKQPTVTTEKADKFGGYISTSKLKVVLGQSNLDTSTYICRGSNSENRVSVTTSKTVAIQSPPEPPMIHSDMKEGSASHGSKTMIFCRCKGGNPVPKLTLTVGDDDVPADQLRQTRMQATVQLTWSFEADKKMNGKVVSCSAESVATPEPLVAEMNLNIIFGPGPVKISQKPRDAVAGKDIRLTCSSRSSNPPATLQWKKGSRSLIMQSEGDVMEPSKYQGMITTNDLVITLTEEDNGKLYECKALNSAADKSTYNSIELDVKFKPHFDDDLAGEFNIVESEEAFLDFTAIANPSDIEYTWYKDNKLITEEDFPEFSANGAIVNTSSLTRDHAGSYYCKAENSISDTKHIFDIKVFYSASIVSNSEKQVLDNGVDAEVFCEVDAQPIVDNMVTWSFKDLNNETSSISGAESSGTKSVLTLNRVNSLTSGTYTCSANNGVGETKATVSAEMMVIVKFRPEFDSDPTLRKSAANTGDTAVLTCKVTGSPEVTFDWIKNSPDDRSEMAIDPDSDFSSEKYSIDQWSTGVVGFTTTLTVRDVTSLDYAYYRCRATNDEGQMENVVKLDGTSKPDPPTDLRLLNVTHDSVWLTWKAGFDGGLPQRYRVRYQLIDSSQTVHGMSFKDVLPEESTTFMIDGLQRNVKYSISVQAKNSMGDSDYQVNGIIAQTNAQAVTGQAASDIPLIIILTVCIVGMVLLMFNGLLIMFFVRRRKKRMEKCMSDISGSVSRANTVEMFSAKDSNISDPYNEDYRNYEEDEVKNFISQGYNDQRFSNGYGAYDKPNVYSNNGNSIYNDTQGGYNENPQTNEENYAELLRRRQLYSGGTPIAESLNNIPSRSRKPLSTGSGRDLSRDVSRDMPRDVASRQTDHDVPRYATSPGYGTNYSKEPRSDLV